MIAFALRAGGSIMFLVGVLLLPCMGLTALLSAPDRVWWLSALMIVAPLALIFGGVHAVFAGTAIIPPTSPAKRCPNCDYELKTGFASDGCSECGWGRDVDRRS